MTHLHHETNGDCANWRLHMLLAQRQDACACICTSTFCVHLRKYVNLNWYTWEFKLTCISSTSALRWAENLHESIVLPKKLRNPSLHRLNLILPKQWRYVCEFHLRPIDLTSSDLHRDTNYWDCSQLSRELDKNRIFQLIFERYRIVMIYFEVGKIHSHKFIVSNMLSKD